MSIQSFWNTKLENYKCMVDYNNWQRNVRRIYQQISVSFVRSQDSKETSAKVLGTKETNFRLGYIRTCHSFEYTTHQRIVSQRAAKRSAIFCCSAHILAMFMRTCQIAHNSLFAIYFRVRRLLAPKAKDNMFTSSICCISQPQGVWLVTQFFRTMYQIAKLGAIDSIGQW